MLEVKDLTVAYGDNEAVRDLTLHADDGEVLAVIGPSGCGKSTLLRAIAGLVPTRHGSVRLDGEALDARRPDERGVGLMFQDHALFPHRSVGDNVAFGPRMHGLAPSRIAERVAHALALVDLAGMESRRVTELSGGEQQRVALARAVAPRPRLLMLDEPLGSLDRGLRDRLLDDLPALLERLGTTVVYVTHDQSEALALADRIAVMRAGSLEQVDAPDALWRAPRSRFVARFLGLDHLIDVEVTGGVAHGGFGPVPVVHPDGPATLVLLPDSLRIAEPDEPLHGREIGFVASVTDRRFAGDHVRVRVRVEDTTLSIAVRHRGAPEVGDEVAVLLDPDAVHVLGHG